MGTMLRVCQICRHDMSVIWIHVRHIQTESHNNALYVWRENNLSLSLCPKNFSGIITQANAYANAFKVVEEYTMKIYENNAIWYFPHLDCCWGQTANSRASPRAPLLQVAAMSISKKLGPEEAAMSRRNMTKRSPEAYSDHTYLPEVVASTNRLTLKNIQI